MGRYGCVLRQDCSTNNFPTFRTELLKDSARGVHCFWLQLLRACRAHALVLVSFCNAPGSNRNRVWKGILGIRDSTKILYGIRENAKYLDGIRDLTATREAGFAKIWARDTGFVPVCRKFGKSSRPK